MTIDEMAVIVTGGTRGIGKTIVEELAMKGAKICFNYSHSDRAANEIIDRIKPLNENILAFKADVRDYEAMVEMAKMVKSKFGHIDALINNAGIRRDMQMFRMTSADWNDVIDINLTGTFNATRSVLLTLLKQKRGKIVNIGSVSGLVGTAGQTNYSASKAGMIGFTKSLAKEVSRAGITVNAILPGYIDTEMTKSIPEKLVGDILKAIPKERFGTSEEVAKLVLYLLSDDADYITGQAIVIDGGLSM